MWNYAFNLNVFFWLMPGLIIQSISFWGEHTQHTGTWDHCFQLLKGGCSCIQKGPRGKIIETHFVQTHFVFCAATCAFVHSSHRPKTWKLSVWLKNPIEVLMYLIFAFSTFLPFLLRWEKAVSSLAISTALSWRRVEISTLLATNQTMDALSGAPLGV